VGTKRVVNNGVFFPCGDISLAVQLKENGELEFLESCIRGHYVRQLVLTVEQWSDIHERLITPYQRKQRRQARKAQPTQEQAQRDGEEVGE